MAEDAIITSADIAKHVGKFNTMETETVINAVPNAQSQEWLERNVPRFICPDPTVEETYWFRWWSLRKHLCRDAGSGRGLVMNSVKTHRPLPASRHRCLRSDHQRNQ